MEDKDLKQVRLERRLAHKAHIFTVYEDRLKMPDGHEAIYDVLTHKGAAAVVPVLDNGKIVMVRQYRNAVNRVTLEVPAGGRDNTEEPFEEAAVRELEEETGYCCNVLEHLVTLNTVVAFSDEVVEVFVAKELTKTATCFDPDEFIEIKEYELKELVEMIYKGEIRDSKTVSAIMSYAYSIK